MNTNLDNNYFLGKIIKIESDVVYLKTIDFDLENKSYIIFKNKIFKTPYVGSILKINSFGNIYVLKINSEKLFVDEKNKYKVYKGKILGDLNSNYKLGNISTINSQVGNNVYLFSNDELDQMESIKTEDGNFIDDLGIIKDNKGNLNLNIDLFSTNVLITGNQTFGKTTFTFNLYKKLFANYLDKFSDNQKFVFLNLQSDLSNHLERLSFLKNKDNVFINSREPNNNVKLFHVKELTLKDYYLLGKIKNLSEARIANDFFEWERNEYSDYYLEDIFLSISKSNKVLKHLRSLFKNLYDKRRILIKNNIHLSRTDKYLNYAILNTYYFLDNLEIIEDKLFLRTLLFKTNKEFRKAFSSLYKYYRTSEFIELTTERFNWMREFIFLKDNRTSFDIIAEIKKMINNNFRAKLNIFSAIYSLKAIDYTYEQILLFASKFIKNWENIKSLFFVSEKEILNARIRFSKGNIFSFDFSSLFQDEKAIAATIVTKKIYEKFSAIENKDKIMNLVIDSAEQLFNNELDQNIYYEKYKNNFFYYLLAKGKNSNVFLTIISLGPRNLMEETMHLFNNFFIFNLTNPKDFRILIESFSVFEEDNIRKLRNFRYGDFYCFGKNFIRLLQVHADIQAYSESKKESYNDDQTLNRILF